MVDIVKQDKEVSLAYMKIFEREAMLIDQGKELGQALERENTRKAELRAEVAEQQLKTAKQQEKASAVIELLEEHGNLPKWLEVKIFGETSMSMLSEWLKISAKACSVDDFLKQTNIIQ